MYARAMRWLPILLLLTGCTCGEPALTAEVPAVTPTPTQDAATPTPSDPEAARQARIEAARAQVRARIVEGLPDHLKEQGAEKFVPQVVGSTVDARPVQLDAADTGASVAPPEPEEAQEPGGS